MLLLSLLAAQALVPIAVVRHPEINEMSGIIRSSQKGLYWTHNDSGDSARIWPIRLDGTVITPTHTREWKGMRVSNAKNIDWEDITIDGRTLYISDLGNNGNARRDLGIYAVVEPSQNFTQTAPAKFLPIQYPDQTEFPPKKRYFDCEAIFVRNRRLYVLTKHRLGQSDFIPETSTKLYALDTKYTDRPNVLKKLDEKDNLGGWVTGSAMSPDGKTLAVLTQAPIASVWFFDLRRVQGDRFLKAPSRQVILQGMKQCEAICFEDNAHVIITNEQRDIFRLAK